MERIAIVTDAWHPQINGVVTTFTQTIENLTALGHEVLTITPQRFRSIPCPTYPEISLALTRPAVIARLMLDFAPHAVHIATEGPLGWAARSICRKYRFPFSSSYHTRFPEYIRMRWPIPLALSYRIVKSFHSAAGRTMVATRALRQELENRGFTNIAMWSRGVNTELFHPRPKSDTAPARPMFIYVGRVAVEKNIEAFLQLDLPGCKVVIGDGPARQRLTSKYPEVVFTGYRKGEELARLVADADAFVFPSLTDTFGVVLLEAMACGVPVAAYPATGPIETVVNGVNGHLDDDLATAALQALNVSPESCRNFAMGYSWEKCSRQFHANLLRQPEPLGGGPRQSRRR